MCRITTEIEERGIRRGLKRGEEQALNVVAGVVRAYPTLTTPAFSCIIGKASKLDSRAGGAKGSSVRKVRAPQGKDNG